MYRLLCSQNMQLNRQKIEATAFSSQLKEEGLVLSEPGGCRAGPRGPC